MAKTERAPLSEIEVPLFEYHSDGTAPRADQIFVFGSNLAGRHGKGAAAFAKRFRGAAYGVFEGFTGRSYAIPTKDAQLRPLTLDEIKDGVDHFIDVANHSPNLAFFVTRIGCGLAGYKDEEIAPMFINAPTNCSFARDWREYLEG
jgi:hypothetical protein